MRQSTTEAVLSIAALTWVAAFVGWFGAWLTWHGAWPIGVGFLLGAALVLHLCYSIWTEDIAPRKGA